MPSHGVSQIGRPARSDRPSLHAEGFETSEKVRKEDRTRRKLLEAYAKSADKQARRRATSLLKNLLKKKRRSLASAVAMRRHRENVCGALWRLYKQTKRLRPNTFTLIPRAWLVKVGQLDAVDPRKCLHALRQDLDRAGARESDGYLILFIHGELDPRRQVYQLHVHGLAAGGMIKVVDRLRSRRKYRSKASDYNADDPVRWRVRINRKPLVDLPSSLTYLPKSYWPSRITIVGPDGKPKRRARDGHRLKNPAHSELLLWLDKWRPEDITLMRHLTATPQGFKLSN